MEHGAVWITYNPDRVSPGDIDTLKKLVDGQQGRLMSPYAGLDSAISLQSWNHQLKVDSAGDKRIAQFADFFTFNSQYYPEVGASCENALFVQSPLKVGDASRQGGPSDAPAGGSAAPTSSAPAASPTATQP
jgi:hypothetical protein